MNQLDLLNFQLMLIRSQFDTEKRICGFLLLPTPTAINSTQRPYRIVLAKKKSPKALCQNVRSKTDTQAQ
jgi:hypothetical protein